MQQTAPSSCSAPTAAASFRQASTRQNSSNNCPKNIPAASGPTKSKPSPRWRDGNSASAPQPRRLVAGAFDIFGVAAAELVDAFGCQLEHAVGERGQEVAVMRDEQHGALEF